MNGLRWHLISGIARVFFVFFLVLIVSFMLFRVMPGDPASLILRGAAAAGAVVGEEDLEALRRGLKLDRPILEQLTTYLTNVFQGELGYSFYYRQRVSELIAERFMNSVILITTGSILATIFGVLLALASMLKYGTKIEKAIQVFSYSFYGMPLFWLGLLIMLVSVDFLRLPLPVSGMVTAGATHSTLSYVADVARHLILPTITLTLGYLGQYTMVMRNVLLDVSTEDYVLTAKSKGLSERKVMFGTVLRNSMLPLVTMIALNFGYLLAGSLTTEIVFSWPGIGLLIYDSVVKREYLVLQGCFIVVSLGVAILNFIADSLYGLLDPRVRSVSYGE